jgi:hypothetical protein
MSKFYPNQKQFGRRRSRRASPLIKTYIVKRHDGRHAYAEGLVFAADCIDSVRIRTRDLALIRKLLAELDGQRITLRDILKMIQDHQLGHLNKPPKTV